MGAELPAGPAGPAQETANSQRSEVGDQKSESAQHTEAPSASDAIMDHLDIPDEVRNQLSSHTKVTKSASPENANGGEEEEAGRRSESEEIDHDHDQEHEEEEDDEAAELPKFFKDLEPRLRKKLEKRFGRLTRKNARTEGELESAMRELESFRSQAGAQAQRQAAGAAPKGQGVLGAARTEHDLDEMVTLARATRDLVEDNPDGIQTGEGEQAKFHSPEELRKWKRQADDVLLGEEKRRRELREYRSLRQQNDAAAREDFPALFDKDSVEHQAAVKLMDIIPGLREHPAGNYWVGVALEGIRALEARKKAAGAGKNVANGTDRTNGNGQRRAIDARAFAPRAPLAPHTADPPSRVNQPSSQKKVEKATEDLLADPDGGADAIVRVFEAMDAAGGRRNARAPVEA